MFSQTKLKEISSEIYKRIKLAKHGKEYFIEPYKHLVIDNFFPDELANACLENFPQVDDTSWEYSNDKDIEVKYRSKWKSEFDIPEGIIDAVRILNSAVFLRSIGDLFDIQKLIPDPYFTGGGINATKSGGLLDVHVDGNYHDATSLNRRMNALIYLNPNWEKEWGGEFGIYDEFGENCVKSIAPLFNRLVVFDSHDKSWHGLPEPINFPDDQVRRSIILYYYTAAPRPGNQVTFDKPHSALWKKRNKKDKKGNLLREFY